MPRLFVLPLSMMWLAAGSATAKDPLDHVQGTEDWNAPRQSAPRVSRERQLEREKEDCREVAAFFEAERKDFAADRLALSRIVARHHVATGRTSGVASRSGSVRRSASTSAVNVAREDAALEAEARRLEERATRNIEQSEGLTHVKPADAQVSPSARRSPKQTEVAHEAASPQERETETPSARELAEERRRAEAEVADQAREQREAAVREAAERRRIAEETQRRQDEEDRRRAADAERRRVAEERRRVDEANRAAAEAKAADRRAAEDAAQKIGGKLDKDGQFVDPDIDK